VSSLAAHDAFFSPPSCPRQARQRGGGCETLVRVASGVSQQCDPFRKHRLPVYCSAKSGSLCLVSPLESLGPVNCRFVKTRASSKHSGSRVQHTQHNTTQSSTPPTAKSLPVQDPCCSRLSLLKTMNPPTTLNSLKSSATSRGASNKANEPNLSVA